ncbi:MAG: GntR family transcriptional regulator [Casimicrobiaceae bacterium]
MADITARYTTKREQAVAKVKDAIMAGRYLPGQALRQGQLMADLDLGATPAREAALELVAKGLLVHESHHGMRVAEINAERVAHVYGVRALLEADAARLAVAHASERTLERVEAQQRAMEAAFAGSDLRKLGVADGRFHQLLYEAAGNPVLLALIEQMWEQFPRYMLWRSPARVRQSLVEHAEIAACFLRRDADATARAVSQHVMHGLDAFQVILEAQGQEQAK